MDTSQPNSVSIEDVEGGIRRVELQSFAQEISRAAERALRRITDEMGVHTINMYTEDMTIAHQGGTAALISHIVQKNFPWLAESDSCRESDELQSFLSEFIVNKKEGCE